MPGAGGAPPAVCLRLSAGPGAAAHSPLAAQNGFLRMLVHSYMAELSMAFLSNLGPFLEDEIIPEVIPMEIEVVDAKITLKVRAWGGGGSPGWQPGQSSLAQDAVGLLGASAGVLFSQNCFILLLKTALGMNK